VSSVRRFKPISLIHARFSIASLSSFTDHVEFSNDFSRAGMGARVCVERPRAGDDTDVFRTYLKIPDCCRSAINEE
jgi:hypothetical protein